ncbi:hypothetical protein A3F08_00415 [Candidatus Berkelbacteria bacterium RIFCSPHIGHO2_12_FULL_36_9]|uniref:Polysaccharide biosynthesis protein C-terminal domain-containing protein n=1 Tax=Candidatus Berkelbacteria bacterium RIFCSPHIGHO2_12_FULL_36_9 TaxID=1797469 RepID=A0A1F5EHE9_9BACT|nr:MAG: hypothetical protein A3F08_00415 [Candidatus Berkelbacteria bacterium RIFCSPHIGHO2_12_FULL_36_9]
MFKLAWQKIIQSKESILKGGIVLFLGMNFVNFGNYLFNMIMGRTLGPSDYGGLVTLISFLAILGVPTATIQTSAMRFSAAFSAENHPDKINYLIKYLAKRMVLLGIILFAIVFFASGYLSAFFNFESKTPFIILALTSPFILLLPINRGCMQGIQNFKGLSINLGLEPFLKIVFSVLLIYFGYKLNGSVLAILIAFILVYLFSFIHLKKIFAAGSAPFPTKSFWKYSAPVLIAVLIMSIFTTIDILVVKHYLPKDQAGLYSGISTISKIVLYFSLPFISAMFPKITELYTKKEKHYPLLAQTFLIVTVASIFILAFFVIFPEFTIKVLFGSQYLSGANILGSLSLAMFFLALVNVFVNYYMAIGKNGYIYFLLIFAILEIVLMILFHSNFQQIINNLIITFGGLLTCLGIYYLYTKKDRLLYAFNNYSGV